MPAAPATRAARPREDTTGSNVTEARGSKDANASFVGAGNRRFPACSQNALRSDDIAGLRPASGQHPPDSGTITRELRSLERQRVPGSEATASPRAVRAGRRPASRRRKRRGRSGLLDPYLNTTVGWIVCSYEGVAHFSGGDSIPEWPPPARSASLRERSAPFEFPSDADWSGGSRSTKHGGRL